jgi:hypothetical protein
VEVGDLEERQQPVSQVETMEVVAVEPAAVVAPAAALSHISIIFQLHPE